MANQVKRFGLGLTDEDLQESAVGPYVRYDDIKHLLQDEPTCCTDCLEKPGSDGKIRHKAGCSVEWVEPPAPRDVTVPTLPTGPLTPELIETARKICHEAGLELGEPTDDLRARHERLLEIEAEPMSQAGSPAFEPSGDPPKAQHKNWCAYLPCDCGALNLQSEPPPPPMGVIGPVSISYSTAHEALSAMKQLAKQGAYNNLFTDDASFVTQALSELEMAVALQRVSQNPGKDPSNE